MCIRDRSTWVTIKAPEQRNRQLSDELNKSAHPLHEDDLMEVYELKIVELENKNKGSKNTIERLTKKYEESLKQTKELNKWVEEAKRRLKDYEDMNIDGYKAKINELQENAKSKCETINDLVKENEGYKASIESYSAQSKFSTNKTVSKNVATIEEQAKQNEEGGMLIQELEHIISESQGEVENLQRRVEEQQAKIAQLERLNCLEDMAHKEKEYHRLLDEIERNKDELYNYGKVLHL
eukprot:TRINITY_DN10479_c0_g1_i3.p1 TRINITY_DN10479_c0_g1~~TRINITY_DN10479_c0_g1_i3.p1  ORF type:complete len:238 (-),score=56.73 TRINITY_DN10479_c0_g1_i3:392-1105(-)